MSKPIYSMIHEPFGLDLTTLDDPGANTNFAYTVPDDYLYRVLSVSLLFTTDANAANRLFSIHATIGSKSIFRSQANLVQVASKAYRYDFSPRFASFFTSVLGNRQPAGLPNEMILPPGATIKSEIDSIQAGDAITDIVLYLQWFPIPR